jgi:signal transduction histidine kinase
MVTVMVTDVAVTSSTWQRGPRWATICEVTHETDGLRLDGPTKIAFSAVVVEGLVSTWLQRDFVTLPMMALLVVTSAIYVTCAFSGWLTRRAGLVFYLVFQNALAAWILWLSHGHAGLTAMGIISQGALVLRRRYAIAIAALQAVNFAVFAFHAFGPGRVVPLTCAFVSGEVFVLVFTEVLVRERQASSELTSANEKLAEYAMQAEELATTKERNRLARELHDSLGHYLTVIHVHLEAAEQRLEHDPARARQSLTKAVRLTHEGLDDVRRSVAALRVTAVERAPLPNVLRGLADELSASGTETRFEIVGTPRSLSPPVELAVYRAVQEALTNVRKHARATTAEVGLTYGEDRVCVRVRDDGQGASAEPALGFGLIGVRERARLIGADLRITANPGFELVMTIPT